MNFKRILGLIIVILGIACLALASYIKQEVALKKGEAQQQVGAVTNNPLLKQAGPYGEQVGSTAGAMANAEIEARAAEYEILANWPYWGGVALIVIGGSILLFCRNRRD